MDREAWQAIVHRITKNRTWLSNWACMQECYFLRMIREGGWWNCILKDPRMWIWVQHLSLPSQRWAQEAKMMPFTCRLYHKKSKHQRRISYQERSFYRGKMQHHFLVEMSKKLIHIECILTKKMCVCVCVCVCVAGHRERVTLLWSLWKRRPSQAEGEPMALDSDKPVSSSLKKTGGLNEVINDCKETRMVADKMSLSRVWLLATPWTVAYQAPLSMGFSRQEYWSGVPLPSPGDLPDPGIEPESPTL